MTVEDKSKILWVSTMYGAKSQLPLVRLHVPADDPTAPPYLCVMSPDEARNLAGNLNQGAEAAESDAFIIEFMLEKVGLRIEDAVKILRDFREFREKNRQ